MNSSLRTIRLAPLVIAALAFSACGGSEASDDSGQQTTTERTTTRNGTEPPPPTNGEGDESLLGRRDVNRGDVPGLLAFATPNLLCPGQSAGPTIDVLGTSDMSGTPVALANFVLCLTGFTPDGDVDVVITFPDGSEHAEERTLNEQGAASIAGIDIGADQTGAYAVAATDRTDVSKTASATAWSGRIAVAPDSASVGERFEITLDGFPPGLEVPAYLYKKEPCEADPTGCWSFRAYLPAVATDAGGHGLLELPTAGDDPDGMYCVMFGNFSSVDHCRVTFTATPA